MPLDAWTLTSSILQVSQDLGDKIEILKVDTEVEQDLASQLQIQVGFCANGVILAS